MSYNPITAQELKEKIAPKKLKPPADLQKATFGIILS